jgi:predicted GNAT family acetyltransferase
MGESWGGFVTRFEILAESALGGKRAGIHVETFNPALALYERLGFRKLREHGVHHFMEWPRESAA